jgi:hypothetical protein
VVDEEPWFFRYEHNMKNPRTGFFDIFLGCVRDYDNCPICIGENKDGSYNMYLTVIDLTEFTDKKDNVHEFSRKLLVVKSRDQNKFLRRFETLEKQGLTLRGALFETHRDKDTDPAIGNDIEFIETVPEEELLEYVREYDDREGKTHTEECHEPFDYVKMYPEKDAEELAEMYAAVGGDVPDASPGSRRSNESSGKKLKRRSKRDEVEDESEEDESEEDVSEEDESEEDESADDESADDSSEAWEDESEEEEEPAPSRRSKAKAKPAAKAKVAPAKRTRRTAVDMEEREPARRGVRREKAAKAPPTRRGRRG